MPKQWQFNQGGYPLGSMHMISFVTVAQLWHLGNKASHSMGILVRC